MHVPAWPVLPDSTLAPQAILEKFRVRSLAGLGDCVMDDTGACIGDGGPAVTPTGDSSGVNLCDLYPSTPGCGAATTPIVAVSQLPPVTVGTQTGFVMPSQSSAQWANAIAALAKSGMSLAQLSMIQPGTVVSANGAILRQATGLPVPVVSGNLGVNANTGGSMLILAGVGLLVVMMMSRGR